MKYTIGIIAVVLVVGGIWYATSPQVEAPTVSVSPSPSVSVTLSPTVKESVAPSATPTPASGVTTFTSTQVATHNSRTSCYTIVRGSVYDVTSFIDKHPGGAQKILNICGKDGTSLFVDQHGGSEKQENLLATFKVGILAQ